MANVLVEESSLQDIADAIRTKNGTQNTYKPGQMGSAIEAIPTGSTPTGTKQISITENGTTTEDVSAYANAEITVNVSGGGTQTVTIDTACANAKQCIDALFPNRASSGHVYIAYLINKTQANYASNQLITLTGWATSYGNGVRWRSSALNSFTGLGTNYDAVAEVGDTYVVYDVELP